MAENATLVGLDVSKARLDVHLHPGSTSFAVANDALGHAELLARLKGMTVVAVGLEASGEV